MNLVYIRTESKSYRIGLTESGLQIAQKVRESEEYSDISNRAKIIRRNFDWNGTRLKDFIYQTFPEIGDLQYGVPIK